MQDVAWIGFVVLLLATGLMRLIELVVSRRRMARQPDAVVSEPWLFPAMAALHTGLIVLPLAEVWLLHRAFVPWLGIAAGAVLVLATVLRVWTLTTLGQAWNVRVVVPQDLQVATTGPYAFIRHPNYLVVILEIVALPLLHAAWLSAVVLTVGNGLVLWFRIRTEERALSRIPAWQQTMADRKRLVPWLF